MHYRQIGWKATSSKILGYSFIIGISSCLLLYGAGMWFSITEGDSFDSIVAATFFYLLMLMIMAIFAVYYLWKFPDILISEEGIDIKVFFYTKHIRWENIMQMQKRNNRLLIFLVDKGLPLNRLYGLFDAKLWDQPIVLFVSSEKMVNLLEEDIKTHLAKIE
jgi:hypothetical protein